MLKKASILTTTVCAGLFFLQSASLAVIIDYSFEEKAARIDFSDALSDEPFDHFYLTLDFDDSYMGHMGFFSTVNVIPEGSSFSVGLLLNSVEHTAYDYITPSGSFYNWKSSASPWNGHVGSISADTGYMYVYTDYWNLSSGDASLYIRPVVDSVTTELTSNFFYSLNSRVVSNPAWNEVVAVPEPATLTLLATSAVGLYTRRNRKKLNPEARNASSPVKAFLRLDNIEIEIGSL